ncbi:MAG: DUF2892 domain-containing protein [Anaerolineaceae bacterium]|nr:DUF2892 domain-containing protein [Anaerolineaceae bacterium]
MFYPKNVPNWERVIRIVLGIGLIIAAILQQPLGLLVALVLIASGIFTIATGFIGWCPACALVGRKIKQHQPK